MYYKIKYDLRPEIMGNVNQQFEDSEYPVNINHPDFLGNVFLTKTDTDKAIPAYPILKNKAKVTDHINGTWNGNMGWRLISNKFKLLLEKENHNGLQFIRTHILHKGLKHDNYWFTNPFDFDMDCICYTKCVIHKTNLGLAVEDEILQYDSSETFLSAIKNSKFPEGLLITKVVINIDCKKNLLIFRWVDGGVGYYVSAKLKKEIEDAGCTGIAFEPVEQA